MSGVKGLRNWKVRMKLLRLLIEVGFKATAWGYGEVAQNLQRSIYRLVRRWDDEQDEEAK